jgi:hypothetical protein
MVDADVGLRGRLLVFVHIPKTAGSTLRAVLGANEPGARSRPLGNVFKGGGGLSKALIERLRDGHGPDLRGVQLVRGHFPLGIREYLPKHLPKERQLVCFTFLREPTDRTLSHYFQVCREHAGDGPRKLGLAQLPAEATLEDTIAGGYLHDNVQTRMLSGLPEPFGEVDDAMLELAKHNLREGLAFFGLTERFDESLVLARERLGLRSILYRTSGRVNAARPRGDEVPEELRRTAERCNQYDIELYRHAQELFDAAPERQQPEFEIELAALRVAKGDRETDLEAPAPARFDGDEHAWRMLLESRVRLLRLEAELAGSEVKAETARSRTRGLKQRMENLEAGPSRIEELEGEVKRLKAADSMNRQLKEEVERLKAAAQAPPPKRDARRESPKSGRARPKRDARRDDRAEPAQARPKRTARQANSSRAGAPQTKARRRSESGKPTRGSDSG